MSKTYTPPKSAINNAKRGLELRKKYGRGGLTPAEAKSYGIDSGITRAKRISKGKLSRHDVRRMSAFNRHRQNYNPSKKMADAVRQPEQSLGYCGVELQVLIGLRKSLRL